MSEDNTHLIPSNQTLTYLNKETGLIEVMDVQSGKILAVQRTIDDIFRYKQDKFDKLEIDGETVYVERGIQLDTVRTKKWKFSWVMADLICQKIQEGYTYNKISDIPGFPPYTVISKWRREKPQFAEALDQARQDRAEWLASEALSILESPGQTGDELAQNKARSEIRKWLVSKDAPTRFGNKVEVSGTQPVTFILETGIRRESDENFKADETAKLKEVNNEKSSDEA